MSSHVRLHARRLLAVATGALLGVALGAVGVLLTAGPAAAHTDTRVTDHVGCDPETGDWLIIWRVATENPHELVRRHELVEVTLDPAGGTGELPTDDRQRVDRPFEFAQRLPGEATSASVTVRVKRYFVQDGRWFTFTDREPTTHTVDLSEGCPGVPDPDPVVVQGHSTCNGLVVALTNPPGGESVEVTVVPSAGDRQTVPLAPGDAQIVSFPDEEGLTVTVEAGPVTEKLRWEPEDCAPPEPGDVELSTVSSCEELTVVVTNPADGVDVSTTVTPSVGAPAELRVAPDETVEFTVPGAEGLTVDVVVADLVPDDLARPDLSRVFAWVPGDCAVDIPIGFDSDCDSLAIEITNPLTAGDLSATVTSEGQTQTVEVAPLETALVTLPATEGTTATVTAGNETLDAFWERPAECDAAAAASTGDLERDGFSLTAVLVGTLVVLSLGLGLFVGLTRHGSHLTGRLRRSGPVAEILRLLHIPNHRQRPS